MSKYYCSMPFNSVRVDAINSDQSVYRPCCMYQINKTYKNVSEYINSAELSSLKNHFLTESSFPSGCNTCEQQEKQGQTSYRQRLNSKFLDQKQITQLELFPGNVCNLRCFMCYETCSTALGAELAKLNLIDSYKEIDNADACIDAIKTIESLKDISFMGGEFFLTKKNLEILDLVIEKKLGVRIVTNATVLKPEYIDRLKKISKLELQISIDGIEDNYEFIRYPAEWKTVDKNIKLIKQELPNAKLNFNFVVQPLNIQYLIPTLDYANKLLIPMRLTNLINPTWCSWQILNDAEKDVLQELLAQQLSEYRLTTQQKKEIADYLLTIKNASGSTDLRAIFKKRLCAILESRKISQEKIQKHLGKLPNLLL